MREKRESTTPTAITDSTMMTSMSCDYRKMIQTKEQQLISLKEEKFILNEQLDDVAYELYQNRKMLEYLTKCC